MRRDPLKTIGAALMQGPDDVKLLNAGSNAFCAPDKGTLACTFLPYFDDAASDLYYGAGWAQKHILTMAFDGTDDEALHLTYWTDGTNGGIHFTSYVSGGATGWAYATDTYCEGMTKAAYLTPYHIVARWTSMTGGELGLPAGTLDLFVNGYRMRDQRSTWYQAATALPTATDDAVVWLGRVAVAPNPYRYADGNIANLEFKPFCLTDEECIRMTRDGA